MGSKAEMTTGQRGLVWAVIMIVSLTMLVLGIVLTIRAVQATTDEDDNNGGSGGGSQSGDRTTKMDGDPSTTASPDEVDPSTTASPRPKSEYGQYRYAAVASDAEPCSTIGNDILAKYGGSTVDAAIASIICVGVVNLHSNGIGGGHFMTIYDTPRNGTEKVFDSILGRERAPLAATEDMFVNGTASSINGGKAIAVPGEIKGLHHAWQKFGRLPWKMLIEPTVELCKMGHVVNKDLADWTKRLEDKVRNQPAFSELLVKANGTLVVEGDYIQRPKLAKTLQTIADDPEAFYDPSKQLAQDIVADIEEADGIITLEDMEDYWVYENEPLAVHLTNGNYTVYGPRPPSGAIILQYILGMLNGFGMNPESLSDTENKVLTYHRIAEAFKYAYSKRTRLADENYVDIAELVANLTSPEFAEATRQKMDDSQTFGFEHYEPDFAQEGHAGTSHNSFLGPDGSAVAITSTINYPFGAFVRGSRTGIIFNNEMDDFSTPGLTNAYGFAPSPSNFIKPGKMPLSSMSPVIVTNADGDVVYISGGSGGSRITTAVSYVAIHTLWLGLPLDEATDLSRIHHQLLPNQLELGDWFEQDVSDGLAAKGHNITSTRWVHVQSIHNTCMEHPEEKWYTPDHCIHAVIDFRKAGKPDGY